VAMTGEISLRGRILPVGGIKEKLMAAYRHGIKKVYLPKGNKSDIEKIPEEVLEKMNLRFVDNTEELLNEVLLD